LNKNHKKDVVLLSNNSISTNLQHYYTIIGRRNRRFRQTPGVWVALKRNRRYGVMNRITPLAWRRHSRHSRARLLGSCVHYTM